MQPRRRHAPAPWERRSPDPQHPIGRARRRWPRAYDGGGAEIVERRMNPRYRRAYRAERDNGRQIPTGLARLRESPVRNGLIGLAIAGAAAPVAVSRYQDALRTDPEHERHMTSLDPMAAGMSVDDQAVGEEWADLETDRARDETIDQFVDRYSDYEITRDLAETIYDSAADADIEPEVAFGLVRAESSFKNSSTSPVGAVGLTQLMPSTARWLEPGVTRQALREPATNLRIGFRYLRSLIDKYEGDTSLALTAYNRGPGTVDKALKRGQNPDNGYADFVYGKANHGHRLYTSR
jgi:soluble lytic murein transglycosylase-like protein